jgi:hypothetical protein
MKLVEAEAEGPVEGEEPVITPPRPPHRRVSVSVLFTLTVLIGTVVTIYLMFPARHNVLLTEAIAQHRAKDQVWELQNPAPNVFHAWFSGVVGKDAPMPESARVIAARHVEVLDRRAAVVRLAIGADEITYLVQQTRGIAPKRSERSDGDLRAIVLRRGKFTCVAVGPASTATGWVAAVRAK